MKLQNILTDFLSRYYYNLTNFSVSKDIERLSLEDGWSRSMVRDKFLFKVRDIYRDYMHVNTEYLKGSNESISSFFCEKIKSHSLKNKNKVYVVDNKSILNEIPNSLLGIKSVNDDTINNFGISYRVYNPILGKMEELTPISEFLLPIRKSNYHGLRDMLALKAIPAVIYDEKLRLSSLLWKYYKRSIDNLSLNLSDCINNISDKITSKITDCLIHILTVSSNDGMAVVYGSFFALVKLGFYTTVWFKLAPGDVGIPPVGLFPETCDLFLDERSLVPGYRKITFQETMDLTKIVVSAYDDTLFKELANIPETNNLLERKWQVSIGLGLIIGFCLSIGVLTRQWVLEGGPLAHC